MTEHGDPHDPYGDPEPRKGHGAYHSLGSQSIHSRLGDHADVSLLR